MRQNHGHDANLHSRTGYRNASTSIASLASGVAWLCSMPWKRPFLWYNPFNRLHLQVKWHATNQQSMRGGHNRQKPAGDGAERPPRREVSSALFGTHRYQIANRVGWLPGLRSAAPLQKLIGCMQGPLRKVKQVKHWTILAWYLYFFVQNWKCRTSTKGTKVPPGHPPLPLSTTRLLGTKS